MDEKKDQQGGKESPLPYPEYPFSEVGNSSVDPKTGEIKDQEVKPVPAVAPVAPARPATATTTGKSPFMALLSAKKNALQNFLGDEKNALRFMSSVMHSMQKVPDLAKCDHDSLLGAFMECAALGLYPGNSSGDCYVLPYAGKAQFQLGYKGIKTLAFRSGILRCGMEVVYANDYYREDLGTNAKITHRKPKFGEPRGEAVGAYAWAEVTPGKIVFKSMSKEEIMRIKATSKAANIKFSPWNMNDPMKTMWAKTAFKQLGKTLPTSDKLDRAIYLDNVSERGGHIEREGEVIEVPFEDAEIKIEDVKDKKAQMRASKSR